VALWFANLIGSGVIDSVETGAGVITFVTRIAAGAGGVVTIDSDSRIFSYGVPFAMALLLAAWPKGAAWRLLVVVATLVPVVAWGVAFDLLASLVRSVPAWTATVLGQWGATGVAVGYQFGSLIFPGLIPSAVAIGLAWHRLGR
jgi:hypothetical protein